MLRSLPTGNRFLNNPKSELTLLQHIHIQNYALIENLDIDFLSGFTVITGETGAGKSILLGALSVLLGNRADTAVIRPGAKRCVVEATFLVNDFVATQYLADYDIDNGECIIRREITDTGKSRTFINDTPATLAVLKDISPLLIDIHSQHQNLLLNNADFQLNVLDTVANDAEILNVYQSEYRQYQTARQELQLLQKEAEQSSNNLDYIQFQHKELKAANLTDGEQEELESELLVLENAESIKQTIYETRNLLDTISSNMHSARQSLEKAARVFPLADQLAQRIEDSNIEIDDIESTLAANDISFDPDRLEQVSDRLNTIYSLQKKYHKASVAELLDMQQNLHDQLNSIENHDEILLEKEKKTEALHRQALATAQRLTAARRGAADEIAAQLTARLKPLGIPAATVTVEITPLPELSPRGQERVQLLFSANKNMPPRPIEKIASGGEIARLMLTLKAMLSVQSYNLPTIIFDEIDTGVSGRIADEMATVMQQLPNAQVISITHNPQIAARGSQHYRVYKEETSGVARTHIEPLADADRIQEIAQMLSGADITPAAISNAKNLLHL